MKNTELQLNDSMSFVNDQMSERLIKYQIDTNLFENAKKIDFTNFSTPCKKIDYSKIISEDPKTCNRETDNLSEILNTTAVTSIESYMSQN